MLPGLCLAQLRAGRLEKTAKSWQREIDRKGQGKVVYSQSEQLAACNQRHLALAQKLEVVRIGLRLSRPFREKRTSAMPRSNRRRIPRVPTWTCPHCASRIGLPISYGSTSTTCSARRAVERSQRCPTPDPRAIILRPDLKCNLNWLSVNIRRPDCRRGGAGGGSAP